MYKTIIIILSLFLSACGTDAKEITLQDKLELSLDKYRSICRRVYTPDICDVSVEIKIYKDLPKHVAGRSNNYYFEGELIRIIEISPTVEKWPDVLIDLLVAHEAEHGIRGVSHIPGNKGESLMEKLLPSESKAKSREYEEWVYESFKLPFGEPTNL